MMPTAPAVPARYFTTILFLLGSLALFAIAMVASAFAQSTVDRANILKQNEEFYASFRAGDLQRMRGVWSTTREIGMTPPGRQFLQGEESVMGAFALMMLRPPELVCEMEGGIEFRDGKAIIICDENLGTSSSVKMMNVFAPESEAAESDERQWRMIYHGPVPEGWTRT